MDFDIQRFADATIGSGTGETVYVGGADYEVVTINGGDEVTVNSSGDGATIVSVERKAYETFYSFTIDGVTYSVTGGADAVITSENYGQDSVYGFAVAKAASVESGGYDVTLSNDINIDAKTAAAYAFSLPSGADSVVGYTVLDSVVTSADGETITGAIEQGDLTYTVNYGVEVITVTGTGEKGASVDAFYTFNIGGIEYTLNSGLTEVEGNSTAYAVENDTFIVGEVTYKFNDDHTSVSGTQETVISGTAQDPYKYLVSGAENVTVDGEYRVTETGGGAANSDVASFQVSISGDQISVVDGDGSVLAIGSTYQIASISSADASAIGGTPETEFNFNFNDVAYTYDVNSSVLSYEGGSATLENGVFTCQERMSGFDSTGYDPFIFAFLVRDGE